ncbi:MAG: tRNA (N6-threonylcarbamoyladenosine(37)-N6)-methyltransferase TrmO [Ruminococcaceae bacterium]|nr:tRNA (N6-threonylcarbamoyladenosine(37)-N6)-methyltransferase TrmO [Oscillospiraceae bacterium]
MNKSIEITPIAHIHSDFPTKFGIPRQSGIVSDLKSMIVFQQDYRDPEALRGIEGFTHLWLIWQFSKAVRTDWSPTVRPPRLGGNTRIGVFATRSPYRPNSLGLSSVKLEAVEHHDEYGTVLIVSGADLMDGTPIFDIKPYIPYTDSHPDAVGGFASEPAGEKLDVKVSDEMLSLVPEEKRNGLVSVLALDPRPQYHNDPERVYGFEFAGFEVKFKVSEAVLTVTAIQPLQ